MFVVEEDVDWLYTDGGSGGLDECTINGCHTLATCQNMDGSMRCVCEPGYTGDGVICIGESLYDYNIVITHCGLANTLHGR